ncbi:MspA family porin [Mycolicibacterium mageritense]|uniref:MspA family porin n=1 Tax=Mycolicibacterium mageritense TaxID=53462 RepID=UPI001E2F3777|nr:MspA family porin [Mycolicibacterium mageritense]MCC9182243.1 MspA family porin [Mycolicibacterium mageritense]
MLNRFATLAAVCMLAPVAVAPLASADPPPPPDPAVPVADAPPPPPDTGAVPSAAPGVLDTPDGWHVSVSGANESQLPVAPLTTAVSSREYLVAGTFTGTVSGSGKTSLNGGTLDTGYQIGCGIELGQVRLIGSVGLSTSGSTLGGLIPTGLSVPLSGTIEIHLKPGTVNNVSVDKKSFKAAPVRVTVKDVHIKLDGCVGQSFLRSYAILTSSTTDTDDVVAYYGVTKAV